MWNNTNYSKPNQGWIVDTKIDDSNGIRNEQKLVYKNGRWWHTDMKMYVYYTPTHWKY